VEGLSQSAAFARLDRSDVVYLDITLPDGEGFSKKEARAGSRLRTVLADLAGTTGAAGAAGAASSEDDFSTLARADESVFSRYSASLMTTLVLVLVLLYLTISAQFESWTMPLVLMLTIPFSFAGAGPALALSASNLDSGTCLGLIVLFGIVVNNGIVLYETTVQRLDKGVSRAFAVYRGARERVRPVLATTLTTVIVLLPLVLSRHAASQRSMAAAMLGGILASTALTLYVLPAVFMRVLKKGERDEKGC
jgi:multidrug efflux pump subunit AcrB